MAETPTSKPPSDDVAPLRLAAGSAVPVAGAPRPAPARRPRDRDASTSPSTAQRAPVPEGHQPARGVQPGRRQHPVLLLPPRAVVAGGVPPVPGRRQGSAQAGAVLLHAGRRQDGGDHRLAARARRRAAQMLEFTLAQPPDRLPDLRQGGRVHAAEALLRLGRASSRATTASRSTRTRSSTSASTSCSIRSAASCARAASASATRSPSSTELEMAIPRRSRGADHGARPAARQSLLAQHRRRLPGRRADLQGLPLRDARVGAVHRRRRSAPAAPPAATSRSTTARGRV